MCLYHYGHYYSMYYYHRCTDTLVHWILLFYVNIYYTKQYYFMYLYTCYTDPVLHWMLYEFRCIHALIILIFLLHGLLNTVHDCILYPWYGYDISVTGHVSCWCAMCETKYYVDLSYGGHLNPTSPVFVFSYFVSCYQQSSFPIIVLHVPCIVRVTCTIHFPNMIL